MTGTAMSIAARSTCRHSFKRAVLATSVVFCSLAADLVEAKEPTYSPQYAQCVKASNGNMFAMIDCSSAELAVWDKALNANYKSLMAMLNQQQQKALIAAQLLWIKYRDANCAFALDPDGGQMARLSGNSCFLRMTAERALELKDFRQ